MRNNQPSTSLRPQLKRYLWITTILFALWIGFVLLVYFNAQEKNMEIRDINSVTRWGIAALLGSMLLTYSGHWWGKAVAHEKAELVAYKTKVVAQISEQQATLKKTMRWRFGG